MPLPKLEGFKGTHRTMVYGIKGVRWTVDDDKSSAAAYIVECCDSQIVVSHKTAKISVDSCKNLSVRIEESPLTSNLDITRCENIDIFISDNCSVQTICVDNCDEIKIHVSEPKSQLSKVWWHNVSKVYVSHEDGLILLDKIEEHNRITMFQHVCKVQEDGTFTKEPVLRENGFPTTEAEKIAADAQHREMQQAMSERLFSNIKITRKGD